MPEWISKANAKDGFASFPYVYPDTLHSAFSEWLIKKNEKLPYDV